LRRIRREQKLLSRYSAALALLLKTATASNAKAQMDFGEFPSRFGAFSYLCLQSNTGLLRAGSERRRAMQDNSATPRNFNSMSVPGLSDEARQAVNAAFDAMSAWRIDTAKSNEKNSEKVIEKMAAAARALGWPEQIVDATRAQLQSITKMQIQMMDQLMDAWEEQIKSPNPLTAPSAMLSKLKSLPGVPAGTWPNADAFAGAAMNPMQFWAQFAEQWQRAWADAMGFGGGASGGQRRR
jgi:hypothetical protein